MDLRVVPRGELRDDDALRLVRRVHQVPHEVPEPPRAVLLPEDHQGPAGVGTAAEVLSHLVELLLGFPCKKMKIERNDAV